MDNLYQISDIVPVFTFTHPNATAAGANEFRQYCRMKFKIKADCLCHGFAGYFDSVLYKDVMISINPDTHTDGMFRYVLILYYHFWVLDWLFFWVDVWNFTYDLPTFYNGFKLIVWSLSVVEFTRTIENHDDDSNKF